MDPNSSPSTTPTTESLETQFSALFDRHLAALKYCVSGADAIYSQVQLQARNGNVSHEDAELWRTRLDALARPSYHELQRLETLKTPKQQASPRSPLKRMRPLQELVDVNSSVGLFEKSKKRKTAKGAAQAHQAPPGVPSAGEPDMDDGDDDDFEAAVQARLARTRDRRARRINDTHTSADERGEEEAPKQKRKRLSDDTSVKHSEPKRARQNEPRKVAVQPIKPDAASSIEIRNAIRQRAGHLRPKQGGTAKRSSQPSFASDVTRSQ